MSGIETRLGKLSVVWPPVCAACRQRPAVVGIGPGEDAPDYPERCPQCGRRLPPVVVVTGIDVEAI